MSHRKFYEQLGQLVYAVAAIDGTIQEAEINRVNTMFREWLMRPQDAENSEAAAEVLIAKIAFKNMLEKNAKPHEILSSFDNFVKENKGVRISEETKKRSLHLLKDTAVAARGLQPVELDLLKKLAVKITTLK